MEKIKIEKDFSKKSDYPKEKNRFFQLKWYSNWQKSQYRYMFFLKIRHFFWKYFSNLIFSMIKNKFIYFLYLYRCKISCSFGLWGFQSDPGTANHSLEPGTMLVPKMPFFDLNAVSGPYGLSGQWILCVTPFQRTLKPCYIVLLPS